MSSKILICFLFILLTAWTCETEEVYIYKVETWDIENIGECECHIRMDNVDKGQDSITCFSVTGDTLHYKVNY